MIRRLRWRFIGSASVALLVVLVTIIGIISDTLHRICLCDKSLLRQIHTLH